jgi:predicted amidophosphoribosyltransferase
VRTFKSGGLPLGRELGIRLWRSRGFAITPPIDRVVPVPSRRLAEFRRGFNPAAEIAAPIAEALGLGGGRPVAGAPWASASQKSLGRRARLERHGFRVDPAAVRGQRILVVDDVVTTGATLRALGEALRAAGAADVQCLVLARTPHWSEAP